jgi:MYXO-CTERM domain-containing protein
MGKCTYFLLVVVFLYSPFARSQYIYFQPDNTGIPQDENRLQAFFDSQGDDAIDPIADASLVPETFYPAKELTFTLVGEGAGFENIFGWYNVGDDPTLEENRHPIFYSNHHHGYTEPDPNNFLGPEIDDLYDGENSEPSYMSQRTLVLCRDGVRNPNWKGGPIGFFLVTPEGMCEDRAIAPSCAECPLCCPACCNGCRHQAINDIPGYEFMYFSEPRLNILEQGVADPYIHHLVYESVAHLNAFYFGFEDLYRGGDNDFEDMLILVEGLLVSSPAELCNNQDDDCDGLTDENLTEECTTACGTGVRTCDSATQTYGACSAPTPDTAEEKCTVADTDCQWCDGIDNDCDQETDEDLVQTCSNSCGQGVEFCVNGSWVGCSAPAVGAEECDNLDNDCDGTTDNFSRACDFGCGSGTETCIAGNWVNCDAPQPEPEVCDGIDNNCADGIDEGIAPLDCSTACGAGQRVCSGGAWQDCTAPQPELEICDGLDNNCVDGVDEFWLEKGDPCTVQQGGCSASGVYVCNLNQDGLECDAQIVIGVEECNGDDDDCDGDIDESDPLLGTVCGECAPQNNPPCLGECRTGTMFCVSGVLDCLGNIDSTGEICDGLDNDCDGNPDNGITPIDCSNACGAGQQICQGGNWTDCSAPLPETERCDGIDNNCANGIDELWPLKGQACQVEQGGCTATGVYVCNSNQDGVVCDAEITIGTEECNGVDDDCDGAVDESDPLLGGVCGECAPQNSPPCQGECKTGTMFCVDGGLQCRGNVDSNSEDCDGLDNDCDGSVDEDIAPQACSTECGSGQQICTAGRWSECDAPVMEPEICDGLDNNCNNQTDEPWPEKGLACNITQGGCVASGVYVCNQDQSGLVCNAQIVSGQEVCDGVDNDCDGIVDEDDPQLNSDCGACGYSSMPDCQGECAPGELICSDGFLTCSGEVTAIDEVCDGKDNNCQNGIDESLDPLPCSTVCGDGWRYCQDGDWTACDAPQPTQELCDGLDNNCNNKIDEYWPLKGTDCILHMGLCTFDGVWVCDQNQTGLECQADVVTEEEICNNQDDDCDGLVDETFPGKGEPCGHCDVDEDPPCYSEVGLCQPGQLYCLQGEVSCLGEVRPSEDICDGLDNDCDGVADQDYPSSEEGLCNDNIDNDCDGLIDLFDPDCGSICMPGVWESCGIDVGACVPGVRTCTEAGEWGECENMIGPQPEKCDGADNDCDGQVDEDAIPEICDDEIDNDCDGFVDVQDSDCGECTPNETRSCGITQGECVAGTQLCNAQGTWSDCAGSVEPEPEWCNSRDDDCDGLLDEGHLCGDYDVCMCGECVSACRSGECPAGDQRCVNGWCMSDLCCGADCPSGQSCEADTGRCVDLCVSEAIVCDIGQVCRMGECVDVDCFVPQEECPDGMTCECPESEICVEGQCQADPCFNVECGDNSYCHQGECLTVGCQDCTPQQECQAGECVDSLCVDIHCEVGQKCVNGICAASECDGVFCQPGYVCENGICVGDPCLHIDCPEQSHCLDGFCVAGASDGGVDGGPDAGQDGDAGVVSDDGGDQDLVDVDQPSDLDRPDGGADAATSGDTANQTDNSGTGEMSGGCECSAGGSSAGGYGLLWLILFVGYALWRKKRIAAWGLMIVLGFNLMPGCTSSSPFPGGEELSCESNDDCHPDYRCIASRCVTALECTDLDGDTYCDQREGGDDCNDNRKEVHPNAQEVCDNIDNNCDGRVDEVCECSWGDEQECGSDVGICHKGIMSCQSGQWGACEGGRGPDLQEDCVDSLDNNCNGAINEGCTCLEGDIRLCGSNVGICTFGEQTCQNQADQWQWSTCLGGIPPTEEICGDEVDNDCDGSLDEDCECNHGAVRYCGVNIGTCHAGNQKCVNGKWDPCLGARWPDVEVCDGLDNNCNRLVDEGCDCISGTFQACGEDAGDCQKGVQNCESGRWSECLGGILPSPELCDGHDNDCDGSIDEDYPQLGDDCWSGTGVCARPGIMICNQDNTETVCSATPGTGWIESCDGLDNDCDGITDEDFPGVGEDCTAGKGECFRAGKTLCGSNGLLRCNVEEVEPQEELCDDLDNDCDGMTDELFQLVITAAPCQVGQGVCLRNGVHICSADGLEAVCDAVAGAGTDEDCNGLDDNCDGQTDENLTADCVTDLGCQGAKTCNGVDWASSQCIGPLPENEVCDGLDNDCNDGIDEDFPTLGQPCSVGQGECERAGVLICNFDGTGVRCNVDPGEPQNELCDGLDNDCDGGIDENFALLGQVCHAGQGLCRTEGINVCDQNGSQTVCNAVPADPGQEICDNLDNDCDGVIDDDLENDCSNACGPGTETCFLGGWINCTAPPAQIEICDGLDNDCDSDIDEDFPLKGQACTVGQGECENSGSYVCSLSGSDITCSVSQLPPISELCDGLDNDCDGDIDENFTLLGESCIEGIGECQQTGVFVCNGQGSGTMCTAQALNPGLEICDNLDNDCDEDIDESLVQDCSSACGAGQETCFMGNWINCTAPQPQEEICDNGDNDCDSDIDEGFPLKGQACTVGLGECENSGVYVCNAVGNGVECGVEPDVPQSELCDDLDNDCDGDIDENFALKGQACTVGLGECQQTGVFVCRGDGSGTECNVLALDPGVESCDNVDNDCDGVVDNGLVQSCANNCGSGEETCFEGAWIGCTAPEPFTEVCDGLDNDCDGTPDNGFLFDTSLEHCGSCFAECAPAFADIFECNAGVCNVIDCADDHHNINGHGYDGCEYPCVVQASDETCNGVDDDCDGLTDEDLTDSPTVSCLTQGVCTNIAPSCVGGNWTCVYPSTYQADNEVGLCDNLDNDCDGTADEDFSDKNSSCYDGDGVCRRYGVNVCSADGSGTECSATADTSEQSSEICDGLDNDCDGVVDNNSYDVEMVMITTADGTFWIDRWEASRPDAEADFRGYMVDYACSREGVLPWDDIDWVDAQAACAARNKRLCTDDEWQYACGGSDGWDYPYHQDTYQSGTCNENNQFTDVRASGLCFDMGKQMCTSGCCDSCDPDTNCETYNCISQSQVFDLSGNVSEWADCADSRDCTIVKPFFGGDYDDTIDIMLTCWFRNNAGELDHQVGRGFRCCRCTDPNKVWCQGGGCCDSCDPDTNCD